jgi:hypothetical protein
LPQQNEKNYSGPAVWQADWFYRRYKMKIRAFDKKNGQGTFGKSRSSCCRTHNASSLYVNGEKYVVIALAGGKAQIQ